MSKIVITGLSAVSSCGVGYEALKEKIATGVETTMNPEYEMQKTPRDTAVYFADFDAKEILGKKGLRTMDKATKMLNIAIQIGFAEYIDSLSDEERPGLAIGTGFGSMESIGNFTAVSLESGVGSVNPNLFGNTVINSPTGNANIRFNLKNLSATMTTGFNSGLATLVYSADYIKRGYLNNILCGAVEEASVYSILAMEREGCLSKSNISTPFGKKSDGFVIGEGCAIALLETEECAKARDAKIIAEISGYAQTFDPNNGELGFGDGETAAETIRMALADAQITADKIDFVVSDANGNRSGDLMRVKAISAVFGDKTPVTSYRTVLGESFGAAGMLDVVAAIADLESNRISPILGEFEKIEGVNLVIGSPKEKKSTYVLITSFSVDGNCTAVVIKKDKNL